MKESQFIMSENTTKATCTTAFELTIRLNAHSLLRLLIQSIN